MLNKLEFLSKYSLDRAFLKSGYDWDTIEEIVSDFESKKILLKKCLDDIEKEFSEIGLPVYVKKRIKDPEHLAEKLIRKANEKIFDSSYKLITPNDYTTRITDLIGFRIIHTFKDDWRDIHIKLTEKFGSFFDKPEIFYRNGDDISLFEEFKDSIKIQKSDRNYRSAHYLVKKDDYIAEFQIRTIFEEAWGEVDHSLVYPYRKKDELLKQHSKILSRIAGAGDEISTIMKKFATHQDIIKKEKETLSTNLNAISIVLKDCEIDKEKRKNIDELLDCIREDENDMIPFRVFFENLW